MSKGVDLPRDYETKLNRTTMTVMISGGLPKTTRKIREKIFMENTFFLSFRTESK